MDGWMDGWMDVSINCTTKMNRERSSHVSPPPDTSCIVLSLFLGPIAPNISFLRAFRNLTTFTPLFLAGS